MELFPFLKETIEQNCDGCDWILEIGMSSSCLGIIGKLALSSAVSQGLLSFSQGRHGRKGPRTTVEINAAKIVDLIREVPPEVKKYYPL